jgi:hypothetical protein
MNSAGHQKDTVDRAEERMPGKKAHKPRDPGMLSGASKAKGDGRKSAAQTEGHYERDPKRRTGQFTGAGDPPMMKK